MFCLCCLELLPVLVFASRIETRDVNEDPLRAPIERRAVESTSIASAGYHAALRILEIEFHSGAIYRYLAVPPEVFNALMVADSKGRYFSQHIRNKFEFLRIDARRP